MFATALGDRYDVVDAVRTGTATHVAAVTMSGEDLGVALLELATGQSAGPAFLRSAPRPRYVRRAWAQVWATWC